MVKHIFSFLILICYLVTVSSASSASVSASLLLSRQKPPFSLQQRGNNANKDCEYLFLSIKNKDNNNNGVVLMHAAALLTRGGGSDDDGMVITKIRNMIRSLLHIGERKAPAVARIIKGLLKRIESIAGISLLPQNEVDDESPPKEKTKKKKKQRKTKSNNPKETKKDDDGAEATVDNDNDSSMTKEATKEQKASPKTSAATQKHLSTKISSTNPNYRIQRELKEFLKSPPPNLSVKVGSNIRIWIITMIGAKNTVYEDEVYKLRVSFPTDYPIVPPSVYFLPPTPQHEHVYTNGDICLSLLGKDWRPTMTAQSIAVSILSILSSANHKAIPMDNARHSQNKPGQFQKDWIYHDDNC